MKSSWKKQRLTTKKNHIKKMQQILQNIVMLMSLW
ncbi:Phage protein [Lactococcus lactis subsp. lactis KF147]|nr:Phage protein [Lactococcus lactis subsp. lactis KF147]